MNSTTFPKPKIIYESEIDGELDAIIRKNLCICFPWDKQYYEKSRPWHGLTPAYTALIEKDSNIIAHAAIIDTQIKIDSMQYRVAGLQNVFVLPQFRKKGFSDSVVRAAMTEAKKYDFDFGLLFTSSDPVVKVYARNGWLEIKNQTFIKIENSRKVTMPDEKHKMFHPLKIKQFPKGTVELTTNDW